MAESKNSIVIVGFHTAFEKGQEVDYVTYGERFSIASCQVVERIDSLNPANLKQRGSPQQRDMKLAFFEHRWRQIEPAYLAWKKGHEIPEGGTSIALMPGLGQAQVEALRSAGFKTIEDLVEAPDSAITRIPLPNKQTLKRDAVDFLEARKTGAAAEEITALKEQLAAAVEMIAELREDRPKRGRPPKAKADDAEEAA